MVTKNEITLIINFKTGANTNNFCIEQYYKLFKMKTSSVFEQKLPSPTIPRTSYLFMNTRLNSSSFFFLQDRATLYIGVELYLRTR